MSVTTFWLILLSILVYLLATDEKFYLYFLLVLKYIGVEIERRIRMIQYHPYWFSNPIGKWLLMRKYYKISKSIEREE